MTEPEIEAISRRSGRPAKFDWGSVDWTIPNRQIATKIGCSITAVSITRLRLGMPRVKPNKFGYIDSSGFDWTLSNSELARAHGHSISAIRIIRIKGGHPKCAKRTYCPFPKVTRPKRQRPTIDWLSLDWDKPDVLLSNEINVSREYVRQKRAELQKPKRPKWLVKYEEWKANIGGIMEITNAQGMAAGCSNYQTLYKYCHRAGVTLIHSKYRPQNALPWSKLDWSLPNKVLKAIWRVTGQGVAAYRCRNGITSSEYRVIGKNVPEFIKPAIEAQKILAGEWFKTKEQKQ
jgi:hypothetical protein